MRKLPVFVLTLALSAAFASMPIAALEASAKNAAATPQGKWNGTADTPDGPITFSMTLTIAGDAVSGELALPEGVVKITGGSWTNGELRFAFVHPNGDTIAAKATFDQADKLMGRWGSGDGESGSWAAERPKDGK